MLDNMKDLYSIGETSKINNISIQTLRYYDSINLFRPYSVNQDTKYRAYHLKQFFYLDIIKYLKSLQMPLQEIKEVIQLNPQEMQDFINHQDKVIDNEIEKLLASKRLLHRKQQQLSEQLYICDNANNEVYIRYISEEKMIEHSLDNESPEQEKNLDLHFRKISELLEERGGMLDNYYGYQYNDFEDTFEKCSAIYTKLWDDEELKPVANKHININIVPAGNYLCIATDTLKNNIEEICEKLKMHIEKNSMNVVGPIYQVYLPINYDSINKAHFLTEIKIRIA